MAFKMKHGKGAFPYGVGAGMMNQKDPSAFPKDTAEQIKATIEKAKNVSYSDAYKSRGDQYKDYTQSEFKTESKRQMDIYKKTGKWDYKNAPKKNKATSTTTSKTNKLTGKTTENYTSADGNFTSKSKTNKAGDMTKFKSESKDYKGDGSMVNVQQKDKYGNEGNIKKEKTITNDPNSDVVTTDKIKYNTTTGEERKNITRTRKKGGTGIGAAIKDAIAKRKAKRAEKKSAMKKYKKK